MFEFLKKRLERPKWMEVKQGERSSQDEDSTDGLLDPTTSKYTGTNHKRTVLYLLLALNILWSVLNIASFWMQHPRQINHSLREVSIPSPLFDQIDLGPKTQQVNGVYGIHDIIFRQRPSKAVDDAWNKLSFEYYLMMNVTREDIAAAGGDPAKYLQWDPEVNSYPAQVEVGHKIHCVDEARKEMFGDHYSGELSIYQDELALKRGDYDESDDGLVDPVTGLRTLKGRRRVRREHVMHCVHILLQDVMCNADVGFIPSYWARRFDQPDGPLVILDDFSVQKKCRNYDNVLEWVHKNAVEHGPERVGALKYHPSQRITVTHDSAWPVENIPGQKSHGGHHHS